jgi:hypothetical protein
MIRRLVVLLVALVALPADAQTRMFRCVDATGTPVFADRPCHQLDAHTFPRADTPEPEAEDAPEPGEDPALRAARCPAPDAASMLAWVEDSFARRDLNGFAALYHWVGATRGYALVVMERMERLLRQPLLEVAFDPEMAEATWSADESALPDLRIDTAIDDFDVRRSTWFRITRHAGCLWLVM